MDGIWTCSSSAHESDPTISLFCTHLEVDGSLVGQVGLVARQSDDYIRTSLSLELLDPVLRAGERLLRTEDGGICVEKL